MLKGVRSTEHRAGAGQQKPDTDPDKPPKEERHPARVGIPLGCLSATIHLGESPYGRVNDVAYGLGPALASNLFRVWAPGTDARFVTQDVSCKITVPQGRKICGTTGLGPVDAGPKLSAGRTAYGFVFAVADPSVLASAGTQGGGCRNCFATRYMLRRTVR